MTGRMVDIEKMSNEYLMSVPKQGCLFEGNVLQLRILGIRSRDLDGCFESLDGPIIQAHGSKAFTRTQQRPRRGALGFVDGAQSEHSQSDVRVIEALQATAGEEGVARLAFRPAGEMQRDGKRMRELTCIAEAGGDLIKLIRLWPSGRSPVGSGRFAWRAARSSFGCSLRRRNCEVNSETMLAIWGSGCA